MSDDLDDMTWEPVAGPLDVHHIALSGDAIDATMPEQVAKIRARIYAQLATPLFKDDGTLNVPPPMDGRE